MADVVKNIVASTLGIILIKSNVWLRGMARHPELCCIVITFLITFITKYGASFKTKPVTQLPKPPQFMFHPSTFVVDSPRGSLIPLIEILNSKEFVFVMYYAPWCYKSRAARQEFLKAANHFKGQVVFAAVNCWWPEGECRKRYKFLMFPVFMAYHTRLDGYRYFGDVKAGHMVHFVENLIHPLQIMYSKDDIFNLVVKHETLVIGFFNLTAIDDTAGYRQFYYASMRTQERDPFQPVKFVLVSQSSVAHQFNLTQPNKIIMLRLTNSSLIYPYGNNITSTNLVTWALQNKGQELIKRLLPDGIKSELLAAEVNKGPALILFHAESPVHKIDLGVTVLKEVVLHYKKCKLHPHFLAISAYWARMAQSRIDQHRNLSLLCERLRQAGQMEEPEVTCCICVVVYNASVAENICNLCQHSHGSNQCKMLPDRLLSAVRLDQLTSAHCHSYILNYSLEGRVSLCCSEGSHIPRSIPMLPAGKIKRSGLNLSSAGDSLYPDPRDRTLDPAVRFSKDGYIRHHLETLPRKLCDRLLLEKQPVESPVLSQEVVSELTSEQAQEHLKLLSQIGCQSNRTLNFYAMDSNSRWMFSDVLGIDPSNSTLGPTAVIVDKDNEEHYVLKANFTISNIVSFVIDYEQGRLTRHQQSDVFRPASCDIPDAVCVEEFSTDTFLSAVNNEKKDVVVLVYAHWCGFCQMVSHTFLALAHYFSTSPHIVFARVNGATNVLPWQFTYDTYPVIILFPAKRVPLESFAWRDLRKADSVVFPANVDKSLANLIRFVLHHATINTKLLLAADVCTGGCIHNNLALSHQRLLQLQAREARLEGQLSAEGLGLGPERSRDYLLEQLERTRSQIEIIKRLASYLDRQGDVLRQEDLIHLLSNT